MAAPKRGEVWVADLGLAAKVRPGVIVSIEYREQDYALVTLVPHTTTPRGSSFEVTLEVPGLKQGAFNVQGLLSVSPRCLQRRVTSLNRNQMHALETTLRQWLAL